MVKKPQPFTCDEAIYLSFGLENKAYEELHKLRHILAGIVIKMSFNYYSVIGTIYV